MRIAVRIAGAQGAEQSWGFHRTRNCRPSLDELPYRQFIRDTNRYEQRRFREERPGAFIQVEN